MVFSLFSLLPSSLLSYIKLYLFLTFPFHEGTGTSTRQLARLFPAVSKVIGIDLSPQMIAVGRHLGLGTTNGTWVETIDPDVRIHLRRGDAASTGEADESVSLVSICLLLHELPPEASKAIFREAYR